jgi:hypothetical protein
MGKLPLFVLLLYSTLDSNEGGLALNKKPLRLAHRRGFGLAFLVVMMLGSLGVRAQSQPKALRLLQRAPLPPARSAATDIRWASNDSVYVSWELDGVSEIGLDGARRRVLVPDTKTLGGIKHYYHLAVSPDRLAVASALWDVVWRPLKTNPEGKVLFYRQEVPDTQDFDLSGEKVLLMGTARRETPWKASGEVAWVGVLRAKLEHLNPVLHDAGGAGAPNLEICGSASMLGAVRFLAGGSFIVAPGFQDGIHVFNAGGQRVHTWTNAEVGIDSHTGCSEMFEAEEKKLRMDDAFLERWGKRHRVLDDILPLPQGPGLLVRSWGADGLAHWTLKVLQPEGIKTYAVPAVGRRPFDRLHGDVRNGRIILLLSSSGHPARTAADLPAEILLMELPKA